ncbi:ABC transporter permease [Celerinatantimonas sp. MCCC 1A17872]|uniref:ABC transporter permease n=1 Tax=Celerinatantimonas sp. MCCC 1A17872 TaxID=3177514 RepID=UPI0038CBDCC3
MNISLSLARRHSIPIGVVLAVFIVLWYALAIAMNASGVIARVLPSDWSWQQLLAATWNMSRPVLPTPHQIIIDVYNSITQWPVTSPRNLLYHAWVTASAALTGFAMGTVLGIVLAIIIVHSKMLDRALLPWIVASQTIPVLAIAPIVLVILGSLNITGLFPKAVIAMYLCFFPITIAMVQGLRSPAKMQMELFYTYGVTNLDTLKMLRFPSALPFLFPACRVAIAAGLVGTMVAELPTGAQAGLGARLLVGSYYGNTLMIWSALVVASLLGLFLTGVVSVIEYWVMRNRRIA